MAQSVLTALVASISNASVTVEILVLLQKYRDKFLELLLKTTSPFAKERTEANAKQQGEKILDERIGEMEEFQAVKQKLASFVSMCDLIGPGEISFSSKEVFTAQVRQCAKHVLFQIEQLSTSFYSLLKERVKLACILSNDEFLKVLIVT